MKLKESKEKTTGLSRRDRMMLGDKDVILDGLNSDMNLARVLAIGACVKNNIKDSEIVNALKSLKSVNEFEFCVNVGCLATSALDLLGVEKYTGDNRMIIDAIECKFDFV